MRYHVRHRLAGLVTALCMVVGVFVAGVTAAAPASAAVIVHGSLSCNYGGFSAAGVDGIFVDGVNAGDWALIQWWHWNASTQAWDTFYSDWHSWDGVFALKAPTFYANGYGFFAASLWTYSWRTGYQHRWVPVAGGGSYCHTK